MFTDIFDSTSTQLFSDDSPQVKTKKTKKNKKKDYKETMKTAPSSPFACKTHNPIKLKIRETNKSCPTCKSCGIKCEGQKGYLSCPESSACFSICSACRICPSNHILRHCVSLNQYDTNPLYSSNKFKCFNCEIEKDVKPKGVYHCGPCSFSICLDCMDRFDRVWEEYEPQMKELAVIKEEQ